MIYIMITFVGNPGNYCTKMHAWCLVYSKEEVISPHALL